MGEAKRKEQLTLETERSREKRRKIFEDTRGTTVGFAIKTGDKLQIFGSGVVVDRQGIVLTARHVMEKIVADTTVANVKNTQLGISVLVAKEVKLIDKGKQQYQIQLSYHICGVGEHFWARDYDLATVEIQHSHVTDFKTMRMDFDMNILEGDEVAACGYPYGTMYYGGKNILSSFLCGYVSAVVPHPKMPLVARQHYLVQIPVNPGNSGGPVFDPETGKLIGIVSRGYAPSGVSAGVAIIESIHHARSMINEVKNKIASRKNS